MSIIIHPSEADRRKTFYATKVQPYNTVGVKRGHFPPILLAALCMPTAKAQGCEDIVVCPEGMRPVRYSITFIEEKIRQYPLYFRSFLPKPAATKAELAVEKLKFQHAQRTKTGLFLAEY